MNARAKDVPRRKPTQGRHRDADHGSEASTWRWRQPRSAAHTGSVGDEGAVDAVAAPLLHGPPPHRLVNCVPRRNSGRALPTAWSPAIATAMWTSLPPSWGQQAFAEAGVDGAEGTFVDLGEEADERVFGHRLEADARRQRGGLRRRGEVGGAVVRVRGCSGSHEVRLTVVSTGS